MEFSNSINRALWASQHLTKVIMSGGTAWQREMALGRFTEDTEQLIERINAVAVEVQAKR